MIDQHQKQLIKIVESFSHAHSNAFRDFCEMSAISLANAVIKDDARERRYLEIVKPYSRDELSKFAEMLACVVNSLSDADGEFNFHDCLGELLMSDEITGRSRWDNDVCFTPACVARMMAEMTFTDLQIPAKGYITLSEPACGAGSMVIQSCAAFKARGLNFQKQLHVTAVEVRSMIAHMAFIQFSLLHIPAIVIHGNSLSMEVFSVWKTPAHVLGLWDVRLMRDRPIEEPKVIELPKGQVGFDFNLGENDHDTDARTGTANLKGETNSGTPHRQPAEVGFSPRTQTVPELSGQIGKRQTRASVQDVQGKRNGARQNASKGGRGRTNRSARIDSDVKLSRKPNRSTKKRAA